MQFSKMIVTVAIFALAANASAYSDGTLRRVVAANDLDTSTKEVNININTNANTASQAQAQQQAVQQPTTIVEASPAVESRAEAMRKARQNEEVKTEQRIVEKLEDSRLQEEKARADRLFGNKLDPAPAPVVVPVQQVAPVQQQQFVPVAQPVIVQEKPTPTQVNIEKVEIIQPKADPVTVSKIEEKPVQPEPAKQKYYVSGLIGNLSYEASNVKSNYGLGVAIGTIIDEKIAIELAYMYSNHKIDDLWVYQLYHKLDQTDLSAAAKYYLMTGKLKPYVGGSLTYVNRKYTDRIMNYYPYPTNNYSTSETTQAVNAGVLAGADFAVSDSFLVGAGADYNFNVMTMNNFNEQAYYLPPGSKELEKISYWTIKVTGKLLF